MTNMNLDDSVDHALSHLDTAVRARFATDPHGALQKKYTVEVLLEWKEEEHEKGGSGQLRGMD